MQDGVLVTIFISFDLDDLVLEGGGEALVLRGTTHWSTENTESLSSSCCSTWQPVEPRFLELPPPKGSSSSLSLSGVGVGGWNDAHFTGALETPPA